VYLAIAGVLTVCYWDKPTRPHKYGLGLDLCTFCPDLGPYKLVNLTYN